MQSTGKNVGASTIGYLQQPLPSQQAGFPQQMATVAARADNERKRAAANANTSALSFITISLESCMRDMRRDEGFHALLIEDAGERDDLNAEIVFEIKCGSTETEARS